MEAKEVCDFIGSCIAESEADGYQQQEGSRIHDLGVEWSRDGERTIYITVGSPGESRLLEVFRVQVTKCKKQGR